MQNGRGQLKVLRENQRKTWLTFFHDGLKCELRKLVENLGEYMPSLFERRYDLTFVSPTAREYRCKVGKELPVRDLRAALGNFRKSSVTR